MVRVEPTAEDSFAAIFDLIRFGIAIAAMIKIIATTIKSSIREKPFCFFIYISLRVCRKCQSTPYTRARQRPFSKPLVLVAGTTLTTTKHTCYDAHPRARVATL